MAAVVSFPIQASFTLNDTATLLPASETPVTCPTMTPATLTSLPGFRPAASGKYAVYPVPPPMIGRLAESKTPNAISASSSSPTMATAIGLRSDRGFITGTSPR